MCHCYTSLPEQNLAMFLCVLLWLCEIEKFLSLDVIRYLLTFFLHNYKLRVVFYYQQKQSYYLAIYMFQLPAAALRLLTQYSTLCRVVFNRQLIDHPRSGTVYNFGRVCLSVCMSVCQTITLENLDAGSWYLHIRYISKNTREMRI